MLRLSDRLAVLGWTVTPGTHARNCVDALAPNGEKRWLVAVERAGRTRRDIAGELDSWANDPAGYAQATWVVPASAVDDTDELAATLAATGRKGYRGKGLYRA